MEKSKMTYEDLEKDMIANNLSVIGLLKHSKQQQDKLFAMPEIVKKQYDIIYDQLKMDFDNYSKKKNHILTARERGSLFEQLVKCLFFSGDTLLFNEALNCRTSTNEIDLLIDWSDVAIQNQISTIFDYMGKSFLCECKNYQDGVSVTYVGKFFSLLKVNRSNFGIMFTTTKIKGKNKWHSAQGLIRKIALGDRTYIITVEWDDLTRIYNGETNILSVIKDKYMALKNDIEYEKYIEKHEMEDDFLRKLKSEIT